MIDGIKIDVSPMDGIKWLSNDLLDFRAYINPQTSELLDDTQTALYNGLVFSITQSKKYKGLSYYSVRGSLHKYFNLGQHNANDFHFSDLLTVLRELKQIFSINPHTSTLRNLEFGVNIQTPISASTLFKNMVSSGKHNFAILKIEGKNLGRCISKQQATLKIYDKAKQYNTSKTNLIRYEMSVNKMAYLKPYGLTMLSDLLNFDKVYSLVSILSKQWEDIIYYDKKVNWKLLNDFERKKLLYYAAPRNWNDFERKQRLRAKKHFAELIRKYSTSNDYKEIGDLIADKWQNLSAKRCPQINRDLIENNSHRMSTFYPLEYRDNKWTNRTKENTNIFLPKTPLKNMDLITSFSKDKNCVCCDSDITHKRRKTKYCSKKCNNKINGKKRTLQNQETAQSETKELKKLINVLPKYRLWLEIHYKHNSETYTDVLQQKEIQAPSLWLNSIFRVSVSPLRKNSKSIVLTHSRARKLIRSINRLNI